MSVRSELPIPQRPRLEFLAAPALLGCLLLAWQGTVSLSGVSAFILPPPGVVLAALLRLLAARAVWRHVGLGYLLMAKMNAYETDSLFAVLLLLAALGCGFHFAVRALHRVVVPWHASAG